MKIKNITISNFRGIESAVLNLDGKSAVLFGINGTGKTTTLDAVSGVISKLFSEAALGDKRIEVSGISADDIRIGAEEAKIELSLDYNSEDYEIYRTRSKDSIKKSKSFSKLADKMQDEIGIIKDENNNKKIEANSKSIPIFVNYGINRIDRRDRLIKKNDSENDKLEVWRDSVTEGRISIDKFVEWLRKRQEIENYHKANDGNDFVDKQLYAVKQAIRKALGDEYTDLYYKLDENPNFYLKKNGLELTIKQLSEGELNVLLLIGDIARRLSIANPEVDEAHEGKGVVLIDEIDSHIHPIWQERICEILTNTFSNVQFITTTHSPKILNSLNDEIKIFDFEDENGKVEVTELNSLSGWNVNEVLSNYMGTGIFNPKTKKLIEDLREALDLEKDDKARELMNELAAKTSGDNVEVVKAGVILGGRER